MFHLKKLKKTFSLLIMSTMLLSILLPGFASAQPITPMKIMYLVDKTTDYVPGENVQVTFIFDSIGIYSSTGLSKAEFTVRYDPAVLEAPESYHENVNYSTMLPSDQFTVSAPSNVDDLQDGLAGVRVSVSGVNSNDVLTGTLNIITLTFKVKSDATGDGVLNVEKGSGYFVNPAKTVLPAVDDNSLAYEQGNVHVKAAKIDSFSLNGYPGVITYGGFGSATITVAVPYGTNVTNMVAKFHAVGKVSVGLQDPVEQISESTAHDFTSFIIYSASIGDRDIQLYKVSVVIGTASNKKEITSFKIGESNGDIDEANKTIMLETSLPTPWKFTPTFISTGVSVKHNGSALTSGSSELDFASPVTLTVTAEDGSTVDYVVTVKASTINNPTPTPSPTPSSGNPDDSNDTPVTPSNPTPNPTPSPTPSPTASPAPSATPAPSVTPAAAEFKFVDKAKLTEALSKASAASTKLTDVNDDSAAAAIKLLESAGIIKGYTDKTYRPNGDMSRGEYATILWRILGEPAPSAANHFPDVKADWSAQAIVQLTQLGIINGYGDGTFRPDAPVSRAEMVTLLMRMLNSNITANPEAYPDIKGNWAEGNIAKAKSLGIVQGADNSTFNPNSNVTRGEAAIMLVRALKLDNELKLLLDPQLK